MVVLICSAYILPTPAGTNKIITSKVGPIDDLLLREIRAMRLRRSLTESLPTLRLKREQWYYVMEPLPRRSKSCTRDWHTGTRRLLKIRE